MLLADDVLAWELDATGVWRRVARREGVESHLVLRTLAEARIQAAAGFGAQDA